MSTWNGKPVEWVKDVSDTKECWNCHEIIQDQDGQPVNVWDGKIHGLPVLYCGGCGVCVAHVWRFTYAK